ncbi:lipopolysaccharide biosynthesis protein [Butyrivibrio sp. NC2007]|uniref:lipopolysaccharide biosynthesis protein n=1 Tax=Butyrivibrio sp. NC2007 TaxID=1280683 RepID=UPI0003B43A66|nr:sugar isomerase [Butyrivibrio sp. NC2007]
MKRKLLYNTGFSILQQVVSIVCGFILPRFILLHFGSGVNGAVNSITQFFAFITFLDMGVGAVVQSSLYKPIADGNMVEISRIVTSAKRYFQKIAIIIIAYTALLVVIFPKIIEGNYSWLFLCVLILAIGANHFTQFYIGITDRLLLVASQNGYVYYISQIAVSIVTTVFGMILILNGHSIQAVKIVTAVIFLSRALIVRKYVDLHFDIDRNINYDTEPIKQKWYGVAQHVAAIILDGTDNIVLTLFSTLNNVSIYAVHYLVVSAIKNAILNACGGVQAAVGEIYARSNKDSITDAFSVLEWGIHTIVIIIFCSTALLLSPFIMLYTRGVTDAVYYQPAFALLLTLANALHCLRLPYNMMILVAGHYKQTQRCYITAALLNIIISVAVVLYMGLIGVAIGTVIALSYQIIWMIVYNNKHLVEWSISKTVKQCIVDILEVAICMLLVSNLVIMVDSYFEWTIMAFKVLGYVLSIVFLLNFAIYFKNISRLRMYISQRRNRTIR